MKTKFVMLAAGLFLALSSGYLQASIVAIEISGHVTSATGSGLPSTIYADVPFSGTYTYDSSALDSDLTSPNRGVYAQSSPYGISITLGGYVFETAPSHTNQFELRIINDDPVNGLHDQYIVLSDENISIPSLGGTYSYIRWELWDTIYSAISSDNLPTTAPLLTDWDSNVLQIYGYGGGGLSIYGTVTQAALIPEPLAISLLAMGAFLAKPRR